MRIKSVNIHETPELVPSDGAINTSYYPHQEPDPMPSALHRAVVPEQSRKWQGSEKGDKRGELANAEPYQQSNGASGLCSCLSRRRTAQGGG